MEMKKFLCTILASMMLFTFSIVPLASVHASSHEIQVKTEFVEDELEQELEFLFEEAMSLENDKYVVNEQVVIDFYGEEGLPSILAFAKMINGEELDESDLVGVPDYGSNSGSEGLMMAKSTSWKKCVGDKIVDATGIGFLTGGMWKLVEKKNWNLLAKELAKIAGKNAIKGGAIGLAASLAWYGIKCK